MFRHFRRGGALAAFIVAVMPGLAAAQQVDFATWKKALRAEVVGIGLRGETCDKALVNVAPIERVIELDRRQPEFTLTFDQYFSRVVPKRRVLTGRKKLAENIEILTEIGKKYGVQPRFIVAFWGVETDFGRLDGGFSVVAALATLAHDGRRSKFFRGEIIRAIRILDQGHITPERMKGSWAGAMGNFQFMPSSFENFAVDYDGDGKRDIWRNKKDAFASAANYLSKSGWKDDQTWGRRIALPSGFDQKLIGLKVRKKMSEWQALGVRKVDGTALPKRELTASLVQAKRGPVFLVYNNYRVILKWNRSTFFAVAVGTLAERIGS
ncbi:MAG: lytic murein transglycosylase [Rhodospirillaceae bacterium]